MGEVVSVEKFIFDPGNPRFYGDAQSGAIFSPCEKYRYALWRKWGIGNDKDAWKWTSLDLMCGFIGLNPSTADETDNDPTIRRCINFAKSWGFGGLVMLNAFAWRETDRLKMMRCFGTVGQYNDQFLEHYSKSLGKLVCAWGADGGHRNRSSVIRGNLRGCQLYHLGLTVHGQPKHPLYLSGDLKPTLWA